MIRSYRGKGARGVELSKEELFVEVEYNKLNIM